MKLCVSGKSMIFLLMRKQKELNNMKRLIVMILAVMTALTCSISTLAAEVNIDSRVSLLAEERGPEEAVTVYAIGAYDFEKDLGLNKKEVNELIDTWLDDYTNVYSVMQTEYYSEKNAAFFDEISKASPGARWLRDKHFRVAGDEVTFVNMVDNLDSRLKITIPAGDIDKVASLEMTAYIAYCPDPEIKELDISDDGGAKSDSFVISEVDGGYVIELVRGDTDGDGEVTILDATGIQRNLADLAHTGSYNEDCADYDCDGVVTILDATAIQRDLAGL